jgi:hypothetical protein
VTVPERSEFSTPLQDVEYAGPGAVFTDQAHPLRIGWSGQRRQGHRGQADGA